MMMKKIIFAAVIASVSGSCFADWVGDVSYLSLSKSTKQVDTHRHNDTRLGAVAVSAGFEVPVLENFTLTPEVQYAFGVQDDDVNGFVNSDKARVNVDLKRYYGFNLRAQYNFNPQFYAYLQPQYTRIKFEERYTYGDSKLTVSDVRNKFGYGGGLGYQFTPQLGADLSYVRFNTIKVDGWQLGMRFKF